MLYIQSTSYTYYYYNNCASVYKHIVHIDLQSFKVIVTYICTYLPYRMPIVYISYLVYLSIKIISMLKSASLQNEL